MKDLIRENLSINVKSVDLLNEQIKMEFEASAMYLSMASWCDQKGFEKSAKFFYEQSSEEREHMLKIFKFVNDNGGIAYSPTVSNVNHEYSSITDVFETALRAEIKVSKSIHNIFKQCRKLDDFGSELFMQWFVTEQLEEEQTIRRALQIFELCGESNEDLYLADKRIEKIED
jgi:ferritin